MGTGKTTAGRLTARKLGWQFYDIDEIIEKEIGLKISEIFKRQGEPYFRDLESNTVKLLSMLDEAVIACGGGAVVRKENMDELEKNGIIVCLSASPETILQRVQKSDDRPLLKVEDRLQTIKELLKLRKPYYKRCSISINTDDIDEEKVVEKILKDPVIALKLEKDN
jgi:shikimate kinase